MNRDHIGKLPILALFQSIRHFLDYKFLYSCVSPSNKNKALRSYQIQRNSWSNISKTDQPNVLKIGKNLIWNCSNNLVNFHNHRHKIILDMIIWILWLFLDRSALYAIWYWPIFSSNYSGYNCQNVWFVILTRSVSNVYMWKADSVEMRVKPKERKRKF